MTDETKTQAEQDARRIADGRYVEFIDFTRPDLLPPGFSFEKETTDLQRLIVLLYRHIDAQAAEIAQLRAALDGVPEMLDIHADNLEGFANLAEMLPAKQDKSVRLLQTAIVAVTKAAAIRALLGENPDHFGEKLAKMRAANDLTRDEVEAEIQAYHDEQFANSSGESEVQE